MASGSNSDLPLAPGCYLRRASLSDIDGIVNVVLSAEGSDPRTLACGRLPRSDSNVDFLRFEYTDYLRQWEKYVVVVVVKPSGTYEVSDYPIAVAVYDIAPWLEHKGGISETPGLLNPEIHRTDMAVRDWRKYEEAAEKLSKSWVFDPNKQIRLRRLLTHKDQRRQGAGYFLVLWGLRLSWDQNKHLTVIHALNGDLFNKLGFREHRIASSTHSRGFPTAISALYHSTPPTIVQQAHLLSLELVDLDNLIQPVAV